VENEADKDINLQPPQIGEQARLEEHTEGEEEEAEQQKTAEEEPMQPHQPGCSEEAPVIQVSALSQYQYGHSVAECPCCRVWQPVRDGMLGQEAEGRQANDGDGDREALIDLEIQISK
jgi:hypothetical protein